MKTFHFYKFIKGEQLQLTVNCKSKKRLSNIVGIPYSHLLKYCSEGMYLDYLEDEVIYINTNNKYTKLIQP